MPLYNYSDLHVGSFQMGGVNYGLSPIGLHQAMNGQWVTSHTDRHAIADLLRLIAASKTLQVQIASIRQEKLNNKYPENMRRE